MSCSLQSLLADRDLLGRLQDYDQIAVTDSTACHRTPAELADHIARPDPCRHRPGRRWRTPLSKNPKPQTVLTDRCADRRKAKPKSETVHGHNQRSPGRLPVSLLRTSDLRRTVGIL